MRNSNIMGGSLKNLIFRVGAHEKSIYRGNCLKRGWLGQFSDLSGGLAKKKGVVFLRGVDTPMHTMSLYQKSFINY